MMASDPKTVSGELALVDRQVANAQPRRRRSLHLDGREHPPHHMIVGDIDLAKIRTVARRDHHAVHQTSWPADDGGASGATSQHFNASRFAKFEVDLFVDF